MMKLNLNTISYSTAIALAGFSGAVATFGMMKLVPGGELVVGAMGALFEAGKLSSFALLHRKAIPRRLKIALATVGMTLMAANIAGMSGFLSSQYERSHIKAQATGHTAEQTAHAEASLLERQLTQAEQAVAQARQALVRARDDKGRVKAAQAILTSATTDRTAILAKLSAANTTTAKAEGSAIAATSELAAINFLAGATGTSVDTVAHAAILTISAIPDVLAVMLLLAAGYANPKTPAAPRQVKTRKPASRRARRPALKVVAPHAQAAQA